MSLPRLATALRNSGSPVATVIADAAPKAKSLRAAAKKAGSTSISSTIQRRRPSSKSKINIVSSSLCDDILNYLGPTLNPYKGCDIIDVNPGPGLWSSKLHEFLSPRSHVLLEPEDSFYMPFLQPLLDHQGSKYRHITWPAEAITTYTKLAAEAFPNHDINSSNLDARPTSSTKALLLSVQGGTTSSLASGAQLSLARSTLYQVLDSIARKEIFAAYDLIRVFFWVNDTDKHQHVPRHLIHRKAQTFRLEAICETTNEVAGADMVAGPLRRDARLDELSASRALERMQRNGIKRPKGRQGSVIVGKEQEYGQDPENVKRPFYQELASLESQFKNGKFPSHMEGPPTKDGDPDSRPRVRTPLYHRLLDLRNQRHTEDRMLRTVDPILERYDQIVKLREELLSMEHDDSSKATLKKQLEKLKEEHETVLYNLTDRERNRALLWLDERRAMSTEPPLLRWDRREYEPLIVNPSDFLPQRNLALLDLQPKRTMPAWTTTPQMPELFDFFVSSFLSQATMSVPKALDEIAFGAAEALIPQVPLLTDPEKGGARDVNELTCRTLTTEMIEALMDAWQKWPFRLTPREILIKKGLQIWSDDSKAMP